MPRLPNTIEATVSFEDGRSVHLSRHRVGTIQDWYIVVLHANGSYEYDGWWQDSRTKTIGEALNEALAGACVKL